ncbi:hypothetical protein SRRS_11340 [Sporomusa rhizae]
MLVEKTGIFQWFRTGSLSREVKECYTSLEVIKCQDKLERKVEVEYII